MSRRASALRSRVRNGNMGSGRGASAGSMSVIAFHEKAGRSQVGFWLLVTSSPSRVAAVATLPSALFDERLVRSVQVGCSRFSRCCHLIIDLSPSLGWKWARRLTQSPELGAWASTSELWKTTLPPVARFACDYAAVRILLHLPTADAARPPVCERWQ